MTPPYQNSNSKYRPDIDGLRALAVLFVIVFHIEQSVLPGGFVGVDIFFVISGYLITYNIVSELDCGTFSIADFYRRRIKRIAPAMIVVVACTVILAQVLTIPEDAENTAESAIWSLMSLANVYFWLVPDQSYFAQDTKELPLLHLWSLGVEEQFYLIWPIALLLLLPLLRTKELLLSLVLLGGMSYLIGQFLFNWSPSFVYYMIPSRAGELLVGAVTAIAYARGYRPSLSKRQAEVLGASGLCLIIVSVFVLSEEQVFPGFSAIPPTFGAAMLIVAGQSSTNRVSTVLAVAPLVWIGLVSYSAYLWHWPLLAFLRYGFGEIGPGSAAAALFSTFLLAAITYRFIEQPARRSKASLIRILSGHFLVPAGIIGSFCLVVMATNGMMTRPGAEEFEDMQPAYAYNYVCQRWLISERDLNDQRCMLGGGLPDKADAILWGDSNAAHYIGVIGVFAKAAGFNFRNIQHASCPPLLIDPSPYVDARVRADCIASLNLVGRALDANNTLLISASWTGYQRRNPAFMRDFFRGVEELVRQGKQIILIGKAPTFTGYDRRCQQKSVIYPLIDCAYGKVPIQRSIPEVNRELMAFAAKTAGVEYFDVAAVLCPSNHCSPFDKNGEALYYDSEHLSMSGSWRIGEQYVEQFGVPSIFVSLQKERQADVAATH
jgi:peptidoglycan/LPS O-acetylase OafA/YrhL